MKNLILVSLFGKFKAFVEANGKLEELEITNSDKNYASGSFYGPNGVTIHTDEIPYVHGKRTIDNISFCYGKPLIPIVDIGINLAKRMVKEIGGVYLITESQPSFGLDSFIKNDFKEVTGKDVYKGTTSFSGLAYSLGALYCYKHKKNCNIISPNHVFTIKYNSKLTYGEANGLFGITSDINSQDEEIHDEFVKRFSKYLDLYEEEKKIEILKGMFLGGYYSYIYEGLEDDIENRYQDRKYVVPFSEIKKFIEEVQIPTYKSKLDKNEIVYSINIPNFNKYFDEYNVKENFMMSQDDFILYAKMLVDFNNDISVKPFKYKEKDFVWFFGPSVFGRKTKEFQNKQIEFIEKGIKKNNKKNEDKA